MRSKFIYARQERQTMFECIQSDLIGGERCLLMNDGWSSGRVLTWFVYMASSMVESKRVLTVVGAHHVILNR